MPQLAEVIELLERLAPTALAEDWDNVGLLAGDPARDVSAVMTCLTLTPDVAVEAVGRGAGLVVAHHPILFRPVQRLTAATSEGRMLLDLLAARIAIYSPHTGYDSAGEGINHQLAKLLDLQEPGVLRVRHEAETPEGHERPLGAGRFGRLPAPLTLVEFVRLVKERLTIEAADYVGRPDARIERVAVACGSAAEFLEDAEERGCQVLLTGEARFHACLDARARGMGLVLAGHYATERPAMERLAETLAGAFPGLHCWASEVECDPLHRA